MAKFTLQTIDKDGDLIMQDVTGGIFGSIDQFDAIPNSFLIYELDVGAAVTPVTVNIKPVIDPIPSVQAGGLDIGEINGVIEAGEMRVIGVPPAYQGLNGLVNILYPDGTADLTGAAVVADPIGGCGL